MSKKLPAIPMPGVTPESQRDTLLALKHAVEVLGNLRGNGTAAAVTFDDLVALGLVTSAQARKVSG